MGSEMCIRDRPKLELKQEQRDAVWAEALKVQPVQPAMSPLQPVQQQAQPNTGGFDVCRANGHNIAVADIIGGPADRSSPMVLSIPCGRGAIRVHMYDRPRGGRSEPQVLYRAVFTARTQKRLWGSGKSIRSSVASLLPKLELKQEQRDAVWAGALKVQPVQPAMSHKSHTPVAYTATVANTGEAGGTWPGGLFGGFNLIGLQSLTFEFFQLSAF